MTLQTKMRSERLSTKRYCCQLPHTLAAKFEAVCDMHPQKTRAHLIADLLALGLTQVTSAAQVAFTPDMNFLPDRHQAIYLLNGPFSEFHELVFKHHTAMERALSKDEIDMRDEQSVDMLEDRSP